MLRRRHDVPVDCRQLARGARRCGGGRRAADGGARRGRSALLLAIAEIQLRAGQLDAGLALVERALAADGSHADAVVRLGLVLAVRQEEAGFLLVEMGANAWMADGRWCEAAGAFEEFIVRRPHDVPARIPLHEIEGASAGPSEHPAVLLPFRRSRSA